jgi:phospholipid/cholesterol/gamma-HCH transport system substrate-binding protein
MQNKEQSIEVKVGALVLFSLALLIGFVVVLGDFSLSKGFTFNVDFRNAGGLKPGADVAIAGINVGTVQKLRFNSNEGEEGQPPVEVRATLQVDEEYADAIRESSEFYITRRGVLGEPYIEIVTKSFEAPQIESGATMRGVDPPRMDVIISKTTELLTVLTDLLDDPDLEAKNLLQNTASLMGNLDQMITRNQNEIDRTVVGARKSTEEAAQFLEALNYAVEDGKKVRRIIGDAEVTAANARRISQKVDGKVDPVLDDAAATASNARSVSENVKRFVDTNEPKLANSVDNVQASTENLAALSQDANTVVGRIESGEGTVGQLLVDREIYDDLKELLRTIKRRPWKIIWKE